MNPPNIVEGQIYFPHLVVPNLDYNKTKSWYELFLAVSDDVFDMFTDAGFSEAFLIPAGGKSFTPDPVIKFATWAHNSDGSQVPPPIVVDKDKNRTDVGIGNGSTVAVQWARKEYGKPKKIVRPQLQAVQILDLIERGDVPSAGPVSLESLAF
jgi:hypothetical protein|tara:strand:- start:3889 stop:4347 length:459 start_codon:yes stop_codon:yes gene_type:complete